MTLPAHPLATAALFVLTAVMEIVGAETWIVAVAGAEVPPALLAV